MMGQMAIAIALPGFNDLGRLVTPPFHSRNRFCLPSIISTLCKDKDKSMWEIEKIQDFSPWDI